MPGPVDLLRLAALALFLALVAVGLWLLDAAWWLVILVMVVALLVAWTIEWLAWRAPRGVLVTREGTDVAGPEAASSPIEAPSPPVAPRPAPPAAIVPPQPPEARPDLREEPEVEATSEPEPVPERPAPPQPEPEPPPATASAGAEEPPPERRRQRRMRLRPVPSPRPKLKPEPERVPDPVPSAPSSIVPFPQHALPPQAWNLWDLERIARDQTKDHPERRDEWSYLLLHLREFATADGSLPPEFDGLVRESFAGLLERTPQP